MRLIVFCHRRALYGNVADHENLQWIELPHVRRNWLVRLYYEYVWFARWSRKRAIDLWISAQDVTPNVRAARRVVYCHNAAPLYDGPTRWLLDPRFEVFRLMYGFFYRINLRKNDYAIVQQEWMGEELERRYGRARRGTIVAHPVHAIEDAKAERRIGDTLRLIYPVLPRSAKNHELLLDAMRELRDLPIELTLTFTGDETRYAWMIRDRARDLPNVRFVGFLSHAELEREYARADALVFPSKLESWGLPLSEFRSFGKPILAADLPYAHETLAGYAQSAFFDPASVAELTRLLRELQRQDAAPHVIPSVARDLGGRGAMILPAAPPAQVPRYARDDSAAASRRSLFAPSWTDLVAMLLG